MALFSFSDLSFKKNVSASHLLTVMATFCTWREEYCTKGRCVKLPFTVLTCLSKPAPPLDCPDALQLTRSMIVNEFSCPQCFLEVVWVISIGQGLRWHSTAAEDLNWYHWFTIWWALINNILIKLFSNLCSEKKSKFNFISLG